MKRLENRKKMIYYCDWCGKELECPYTVLTFLGDKNDLHLCSIYTSKISKTCYDKYQEEQYDKYRKEQLTKQNKP